jgi:hypothetical protein
MVTRSGTLALAFAAALWCGESARAADPPQLSPATAATKAPDFRRHVMPLLTRLGCSTAACHGAATGQGDFRLSLFGYDLKADHEALVTGEPLRANWKVPEESLILSKPTLVEPHGGGQRFEVDGPEYQLLLNWVRHRAPDVPARQVDVQIDRLVVTPSQIVLADQQPSPPIQVTAHWNDGSSEDVTWLVRLEVKDDSIAQLAKGPKVTRKREGATHLIVYYDRAIATAEIIAPIASPPAVATPASPKTAIDRLIAAKLDLLEVAPAALCDDEEFLRRVRLDATGTLPSPAEVIKFSRNPDPQKRQAKIDELLASEEHAVYWAHWLSDLVGNRATVMRSNFGEALSRQWYDWLHARVASNMPYDQIAFGMILGKSRRDGQSFDDYCKEMTASVRAEGRGLLTQRESVPYFWDRTNVAQPQAKALAFSYVFLGVKLQCAECHKHPFDRWTKEDFEGMRAFFEPLRHGTPPADQAVAEQMRLETLGDEKNPKSTPQKAVADGKIIPWSELYVQSTTEPVVKFRNIPVRRAAAPQPLESLVAWTGDPQHHLLAIAYVNRVWAHYFGAGVVEPCDDLNLANPPVNRELLDYLTLGFIEHDYDMRWLHREIVSSDAYQRSWQSQNSGDLDRRQFARAALRRMPAEVMYDALFMATASDEEADRLRTDFADRMIGPAGRAEGPGAPLVAKFGRPQASAVCERTRSDAPNLGQALAVQNHPLIEKWIDRPEGWVAQLRQETSGSGQTARPDEKIAEIVRQCYLRTLSRAPDDEELQIASQSLRDAESLPDGARTLLWALLQVKEFSIVH